MDEKSTRSLLDTAKGLDSGIDSMAEIFAPRDRDTTIQEQRSIISDLLAATSEGGSET